MLTKFGKILAIIASALIVAGGISRAAIDDEHIASAVIRISALEATAQQRADDHYMICYIFTKMNAGGVPATCNSALAHTH